MKLITLGPTQRKAIASARTSEHFRRSCQSLKPSSGKKSELFVTELYPLTIPVNEHNEQLQACILKDNMPINMPGYICSLLDKIHSQVCQLKDMLRVTFTRMHNIS